MEIDNVIKQLKEEISWLRGRCGQLADILDLYHSNDPEIDDVLCELNDISHNRDSYSIKIYNQRKNKNDS